MADLTTNNLQLMAEKKRKLTTYLNEKQNLQLMGDLNPLWRDTNKIQRNDQRTSKETGLTLQAMFFSLTIELSIE